MDVQRCALVVFGINTGTPTIIAIEETVIDAISQHNWVVLARDSDVLGAGVSREALPPAPDAIGG